MSTILIYEGLTSFLGALTSELWFILSSFL